jgi:hypothetical protein
MVVALRAAMAGEIEDHIPNDRVSAPPGQPGVIGRERILAGSCTWPISSAPLCLSRRLGDPDYDLLAECSYQQRRVR